MLGVGCGVLVIGVGVVWLVIMCCFFGSCIFEWVMLLFLVIFVYIFVYIYIELLEFYGFV